MSGARAHTHTQTPTHPLPDDAPRQTDQPIPPKPLSVSLSLCFCHLNRSKVTVDLVGSLEDGTVFDDRKGHAFVTDDEQVVKGLDKVVMELKKGEKCLATFPPDYGYGDEGGECGGRAVPSAATLSYEVTLVDFENAKEAYEMDAAEMMEAALAFKEKGNAYFKKRNYEMAVSKYSKAVKYLEFDSKYTEDEKAEARKVKSACWNNEAQCGLKTKDFLAARKACDKVLKQDSQNIKALYRRAQTFIGTNDFIEAKRDLGNALAVDPDCKEAKLEMRRLAKLQQQRDAKEKKLYANMFEKLSKMEANDPKATPVPAAASEECKKGCCAPAEEEPQAKGCCDEGCCS